MPILFLILSCLLVQNERKTTPETAIDTVLNEANELYKTTMESLRNAKSSADGSDALLGGKEKFREWANSIDSIPFEFKSRVLNIVRDQGVDSYHALISIPKELQQFTGKRGMPTTSVDFLKVEISNKQREAWKINDKIVVSGKLDTFFQGLVECRGGKAAVVSRDYVVGGTYTSVSGPPLGGDRILFTCLFTDGILTGTAIGKESARSSRVDADFVTFVMEDVVAVSETEHSKAKREKAMNEDKKEASK